MQYKDVKLDGEDDLRNHNTPDRNHDRNDVDDAEVEPIAIVGMSCRFPGDASSVKGLWQMCCEGRSAWSEVPQDRMNAAHFFHPNPAKHGSVSR